MKKIIYKALLKFFEVRVFKTAKEICFNLDFDKTIFLNITSEHRLFLMFNEENAFVVEDDGFDVKTLFEVGKTKFKVHFLKEGKKDRLYIEGMKNTLPVNCLYSGDIVEVKNKLNCFINN